MKILLLAPVAPWARENGSSLIIADQLEALGRRRDVDVFALFLRRQAISEHLHGPKSIQTEQLSHEGRPRWASLAHALIRQTSPILVRFDNSSVAASVLASVRASGFQPDLVHVEHLPLLEVALAVGQHYGAPVVYRSHNIEAVLLLRRARLPRLLAGMFARLVERAECNAMERAALTLCISQTDAQWVSREAPAVQVEALPCAVDVSRYPIADESHRNPLRMGFVGGLDWEPNESGLRWFVEMVLPLVLAQVPSARLQILARGAAGRSWLTQHPSIDIMPALSTPLDLFSQVGFSIAPLLEGGGVRIKIPESLSLGCPVVATTVGAEGHELPGIVRADEPSSFADACARMLSAPCHNREKLREAVQARHGADVVAEQLVAAWNRVRQ